EIGQQQLNAGAVLKVQQLPYRAKQAEGRRQDFADSVLTNSKCSVK
ncbi:hypothetical protein LINGRAHAP2_LOCUS26556, partial [Linum grandiflorum]